MTAEARRPEDPEEGSTAARPGPLDVGPLISNNPSALPEVYEAVHSARTAAPAEIGARTGRDRQVVHANLDRLVAAGLVAERTDSTYRPVEPALAPAVVQSLAELGSTLRWELCAFAVDEGDLVVEDVREAFDLSSSNARKLLNALADAGYLAKRSGARDGSRVTYRITEAGERALVELEDPAQYLDHDGETVEHYATGIEGTAFRTAYEVEDAALVARLGPVTVGGLLAETDKEEKSTRRRLARLADRGLLEETRRRGHNEYRPTPRTRRMVDAVRDLENERRLWAWERTVPPACRERLPDPFFPDDVFEAFSALLDDASPDLADRYVSRWKSAGLVEGNRHEGFRLVEE